MKRFLTHLIKLISIIIFCISFLYFLHGFGISRLLDYSKKSKIIFSPKHTQTIIDFKLSQERKELSIIGSSRTSGFEKDMFLNESVYLTSKALGGIDFRAKNLESLDNLEKNSIDFYASVKSLYQQDRENKIKNNQRGNIEVLYKDEEDWEEIDNQ